MDTDSLIQKKIDEDTEFQASLVELSDDEKTEVLRAKHKEILDSEFAALSEKAEKGTKAEELANNYKTRAEKAERQLKEGGATVDTNVLSTADTIALLTAKVHEDDIERVERFAKSEGISIKEALKNTELKAILSVRSEERETATAANIGPARRGKTESTGESLLEKANAGNLPDSDDEISRLMQAKMGKR